MTDDANGCRLIHRHHDFQDVHRDRHGRDRVSSVMLLRYDLAAAVAVICADVAAVMILVNLASSFPALHVHVLPKVVVVFMSTFHRKEDENEKKKKRTFKFIFFHERISVERETKKKDCHKFLEWSQE